MATRPMASATGLTLLELLFALAIVLAFAAMAVPLTADVLGDIRAGAAARYMAGRLMAIRMEAVKRSTSVALRFEPVGADYAFAVFEDGNGNGVRSLEIHAGIDRQLAPAERLGDKFPGIRFELGERVPDAEGHPSASRDGVRIGSSRILTMSADGSCTSGTLYLRGRNAQYAVRALGATGRTRVLYFHPGAGKWITR